MATSVGSGPFPPFHQRLHAAVLEHGATLDSLQRRLAEAGHPIARSTLSYWQNGHRVPRGAVSLRVVRALEEILQVPAGSLQEALVTATGPAPSPASDVVRVAEPVDRLLQQAGCRQELSAAESLSVVELAGFGATGECHTIHTIQALRALTDCQRYPLIHLVDADSDVERIEYYAVGGCRIGRVRRDAAAHVVVAELLFDRYLRRGETHLARFVTHDANRNPVCRFSRVVPAARTMVSIELSFHPHALPVQLQEYERGASDAADVLVSPRTLGFDRRVALIRQRARRGVVGMRWDYR